MSSFRAFVASHRARLAAAGLAVVAVLEVSTLLRVRAAAPEESDWTEAAAWVSGEHRPGDLVVFAPRWVDPVGRQHLGQLLTIDDAARMDAARYARVWEVSIRDAAAPEVEDMGAPAATRTFGAVRVRRFERQAPAVTWDLRDRSSLNEVGFEPHRCAVVMLAGSEAPPATLAIPAATLGESLHVAAGLADFRSRRDNDAEAVVRVLVDGAEVSRGVVGNETGWRALPPARTTPGPHAVTFEASVREGTGHRRVNLRVCLAAEARTP